MSGAFAASSSSVAKATLRNRCVGWIVDAFHGCNDKELILKAFEQCTAGPFNCSQASLTSPQALEALRNLPNTHPALHMELTAQKTPLAEEIVEPAFPSDDLSYEDESDVPVEVVRNHVVAAGTAALPAGFVCNSSGDLERSSAAEDTELDVNPAYLPLATRRAKRNAKAPSRYGGEDMWDKTES
ncbi:hypothetical protein B0H14DRAFT_3868461 [Mycena olivaceomarginata]|nr:hypothetical protein B0H14DRAFT_3868461 [Mycena olivaceomarginata]